ncbi:signal peptidase I [Candidatus Latescibacterota bacterium]
MSVDKKKSPSKPKSKKSKLYSRFTKFRKEWLEPIIIALILVVFIKTFLIQNFKIPSSSMEETLLIGDRLFAVKFLYGTKIPFTKKNILKIRDPKPGDVIIFRYPMDPSTPFIKRCVAVGGQTVEIRDKKLYVDDVLQDYPEHVKFIDNTVLSARYGVRDNYPPTKIPEGSFFAMGDNRDNSNDSRYWGFVPYENIKGKALFIYWSLDDEIPFYNVIYKIRWRRLFNIIR